MTNNKHQTATSLHIFKQNLHNDLRSYAPPSEVRVYKLINGEEIFDRVEPPISYEEALIRSHQNYGIRANKNRR